MYYLKLFPMSDILLIAAICQMSVFIISLILNRKGDWRLNIILVFVLFFQGVPACSLYILFHSYEIDYFPLAHIGNATVFCIGPLLYLYLRKYLTNHFFRMKTDIIHGVFFILAFALFVLIAKAQDGNYMRRSADALFSLILFLYTLSYSLFSLKLVIQNRKNQMAEKRSLFWPMFLFIGSLVLLFGRFVIFLLWELVPHNYPSPVSLELFYNLSPYSVSLYFMGFFFFTNILILLAFSGMYILKSQTKYKRSRLSSDGKLKSEKQLRELMDNEKPYLDPLLSLNGLARKLHLSTKELSQIINECFAMNFSDFINSFRVKEVIRLFEQDTDNRTILDISLEAGFNSKSTFNHVFKKTTGLSPRDYLKKSVTHK